MLRAVDQMWGKIDYGVFHSSFYTTFSTLRVPQVLTVHDMIYEMFHECFSREKDRLHIEDKRRCANTASAVICPSQSTLRAAQKYYDFDGKITAVIPHAVDPIFYTNHEEDQLNAFRTKYTEGFPFILYVGDRWAHKNFIGLLTAYFRWKGKANFRLLAVGGGAPSHYELSAIRCLGVHNTVHFCPDADDTDLALAYKAASAVVVPALYEGFGFPVLEAMACGTPVASSLGGSLPEVGGETPVYFDSKSNDQLVDALDKVIRIPRHSERVQNGILRARERTWEKVVEEYVRVYRALALQ
jgi:glycosyltransferase involved in cell wall biosynthesis